MSSRVIRCVSTFVVKPLSVRAPTGHDLDGLDVARDDGFKAPLDLHPEADVNSPLLQKRAPERAACEPRARGLRKEAPALHHDVAAHRTERDDPVDAVSGPDRHLVELSQAIELQAV